MTTDAASGVWQYALDWRAGWRRTAAHHPGRARPEPRRISGRTPRAFRALTDPRRFPLEQLALSGAVVEAAGYASLRWPARAGDIVR